MFDNSEKWKIGKEPEYVVENICNDTILTHYAEMKLNDMDQVELKEKIGKLHQEMTLLISQLKVKEAERDISSRKLWEEAYRSYPILKEYGRLTVVEKGKHLAIVVSEDKPFPFFSQFFKPPE